MLTCVCPIDVFVVLQQSMQDDLLRFWYLKSKMAVVPVGPEQVLEPTVLVKISAWKKKLGSTVFIKKVCADLFFLFY